MSRAFALAVLAVGLLSGMDAAIKGLAAAFSVPQIALLRFIFGSLAISTVVRLSLRSWTASGQIPSSKSRLWRMLARIFHSFCVF